MMKEDDSKIAEQIKSKMLEQDDGRIRRIILYGSRVAGTARPTAISTFWPSRRIPCPNGRRPGGFAGS